PATIAIQHNRKAARFIDTIHPITMYKGLKITVIIPCLNEEQGIEKVLSKMPSFVDEVIVGTVECRGFSAVS
ncbi:MAG: hypothetical protein ONB14_03140, partial [candidate division KSB1 bacterium]|nr:hypothetical protein [candidate division KSB1 bacterium]